MASSSAGEGSVDDTKKAKFTTSKARLIRLYGKNEKSNGKLKAAQELIAGKEFKEIAQTLHMAEATAQVYGINAFAAGAPIDHAQLARSLQVTEPNFTVIQCCIEQNKDLNRSELLKMN